MTAEEKIASLEKQLQEALEQLKEVTDLLQERQEQLQQAQSRIAELEKQKTPVLPLDMVENSISPCKRLFGLRDRGDSVCLREGQNSIFEGSEMALRAREEDENGIEARWLCEPEKRMKMG